MSILSRIVDSFKYLDKNGLKKVAAITERMFRFKTMPTAEQRWEGKLVQYIGTTDATYTQGYFYICKKDETTGTYIWEQTDVQPNNDYVLWDGTHAQYEAEQDGIPVGAFLNFTDDYDENVKVGIYSTEETKTGELFLNKPVYRTTVKLTSNMSTDSYFPILNIDTLVDYGGTIYATPSRYKRSFPWKLASYAFDINGWDITRGINVYAMDSSVQSIIGSGSTVWFKYTKVTD